MVELQGYPKGFIWMRPAQHFRLKYKNPQPMDNCLSMDCGFIEIELPDSLKKARISWRARWQLSPQVSD